MTTERERLVRAIEAVLDNGKTYVNMAEVQRAQRALAAYDAAHPEEAK